MAGLVAHDWVVSAQRSLPPFLQSDVKRLHKKRAKNGYWALKAQVEGSYRMVFARWPEEMDSSKNTLNFAKYMFQKAVLTFPNHGQYAAQTVSVSGSERTVEFDVSLAAGDVDVQCTFHYKLGRKRKKLVIGAYYGYVSRN